jgi:hypothetical protein
MLEGIYETPLAFKALVWQTPASTRVNNLTRIKVITNKRPRLIDQSCIKIASLDWNYSIPSNRIVGFIASCGFSPSQAELNISIGFTRPSTRDILTLRSSRLEETRERGSLQSVMLLCLHLILACAFGLGYFASLGSWLSRLKQEVGFMPL